jgi:signal transduction histidine kinase/ligand-binding sensor domain-containing protein
MDRTRTFLLAAVMFLAPVWPAAALNPAHGLSDYSLRSWLEDEAPFPFGVYAITQDRDGFLVLGTRNGIVRFDGTTFTIWKSSSELLDDRISELLTAVDGSVWVGYGTASGVSRIIGNRIIHFSVRDGLTAGAVSGLAQGSDGAIWASTYSGISKFDGTAWVKYDADQGLPDAPISGLSIDTRSNLYAATARGIYRMAPGHGRFERFSPLNGRQFAEDRSGTVWVTDRNTGIRAVDGRWKTLAKAQWKGAVGWVVLHDRSGSLWLGTRGHGVRRIRGLAGDEPGGVTIDHLTRSDGLPTNEVRSLFEDRDGTIWIGTRLGLSRLSESTIQTAPAPSQDAFVEAVITTRDGSVWTGTADGLHRSDGHQQRTYGVEHGLPGRVISALHEDTSGTLWVATTQGIAYRSGDRFITIKLDDVRLQNVSAITSDRAGGVWICDTQGIFRWHDGRLTKVDAGELHGPPYAAFTDTAGRVWIGFWTGGITMFDGDRRTSFSAADGLPAGTITVIYQDRGGSLWVGTSRGVARYDGRVFHSPAKFGFPRSAAVSIIEDDYGSLWFGLAVGLLRIDREEFTHLDDGSDTTLAYRVFGIEDGLPGTLGRPGMPSSAQTADGRLWFVTSSRVAIVDPKHLAGTKGPGPLRIEEFVADGHPLETVTGLSLGPNLSRIQISYATLSLSAAAKPRFRYKLEHFDTDWQEAGNRRQASYTNLPPGNYRFKVVSNDASGGWNESGAELSFYIRPAIYQTYSFYLALAMALAVLLWSAYRLRLRRLRTQFDLVLAERARMGREIHDTLLQSLVGVALEFDDISEQLEPSASLNTQVRRIRQQVEHYIREARQSIWNLRSPSLTSSDLPTALGHFADAATHGHHATLDFRITGPVERAPARVEEQLLRIGQEAISNAVRHSGADAIAVELCYEPGKVTLTVEDNGCGFDPEQVACTGDAHWGVTSMRERALQIGGSLELRSAPGEGTRIRATAHTAPKHHEAAEATHSYPLRRRSSAGA